MKPIVNTAFRATRAVMLPRRIRLPRFYYYFFYAIRTVVARVDKDPDSVSASGVCYVAVCMQLNILVPVIKSQANFSISEGGATLLSLFSLFPLMYINYLLLVRGGKDRVIDRYFRIRKAQGISTAKNTFLVVIYITATVTALFL
ncbi:hypothetical protein [Flaviaesturariibacter amylovorans]|uniref:hypothetical protein n=1 Tax=Flaviaesturariibacter amylovorans TaxID=1084520 RepID=UPI0031E71F98